MTHTTSNYRRLTTTVLALACLLLSPLSFSQSLSESDVQAFIRSMQAMQPLQDKYQDVFDAEEDDADDDIDFSRLMSDGIRRMKGHPAYNEVESLVKQQGFSDIENWASIGDKVVQAWFALEMGAQSPQIQAEMNAAMAEIENNPNMSEAQKAQMRAMMQQGMSAMATGASAPEANKKAVRPYLDQLKAVMDTEE
ncbi:hypothetical protein C7H09_01800 [Marinobacter fuscus]|uniref:Uncharacterized protein n=1 Tax=Marinobacter fuscus TaxID=2109942 RepID=A0A2T1KTH7_9GAMM|nr:hypothetical protein [Marinobacter fuscus]PSF13370.1 hypothetical protein C7H09_01800 [Marinobacter fuscus]